MNFTASLKEPDFRTAPASPSGVFRGGQWSSAGYRGAGGDPASPWIVLSQPGLHPSWNSLWFSLGIPSRKHLALQEKGPEGLLPMAGPHSRVFIPKPSSRCLNCPRKSKLCRQFRQQQHSQHHPSLRAASGGKSWTVPCPRHRDSHSLSHIPASSPSPSFPDSVPSFPDSVPSFPALQPHQGTHVGDKHEC